jgi:murein DD-endopeptidase MepM/ murein hydrolase activator NlpD
MNTKKCRHLLVSRLAIIILSAVLAVSLVLIGVPNLAPSKALAVTSAEKQAEVDAALGRLDALQTEINKLTDDYAAAELAHADAERKMVDAKNREEAAEIRIVSLQDQLGTRAQSMYRSGQITFLDFLFGADSFTEFITAVDLVNRVNAQDAKLVEETKVVHAEAEAARIEYTEQERISKEKQDELGRLKADKEQASANMQAEITVLQAEAVELLAQEELAAEAAKAAAAAGYTSSTGAVNSDQLNKVRGIGLRYPLGTPGYSSSGFGPRWGTFHKGADFAAPTGTTILASASGTVASAAGGGWNGGMGSYVIINHGSGVRTIYMHASAVYVSAGQTVNSGDVIAAVGSTGDSTGPHLHFQVEVDGVAVDPAMYV